MRMSEARLDADRFGPWAMVTGASSGIGREFARQLAANRFNILLVARRGVLLAAAGREFASRYGVEYRVIEADLADPACASRLADETVHLDVGLVVSNAGTGSPGPFLRADLGELHKLVQLNAVTHLDLAHRFGQRLATRGKGGLLLVSAFGAQYGIPYLANDAAAKAYVLSLGRGLNAELGRAGLNVSVLLPGVTDTPVLAKLGVTRERLPITPMSTEQCVGEALRALAANRPICVPGRLNRVAAAVVPGAVTGRIMGRLLGARFAG